MSQYDIQTVGILIDQFMPLILPTVFLLGIVIGSFGHYFYVEWEYKNFIKNNKHEEW